MSEHFRKFLIAKLGDEWFLWRESHILGDPVQYINRYRDFPSACRHVGRLIDMLVNIERELKKAALRRRVAETQNS